MWSRVKKMTKRTGTSTTWGRQQRAKDSKGKGKGKNGKGGFKGKNTCGKKWDTGQASGARRQHISEATARTTIHQDDLLEEETDMGTLDECVLEDVEESKNDASKSTMSKITTVPAPGLTPSIILKQCEEIVANLQKTTKKRNEAQEQSKF